MENLTIQPARGIRGDIMVPGDKSISHRAVIVGSMAVGETVVRGFLRGEDNYATLNAFRAMGIRIEDGGDILRIEGKGIHGLSEPGDVLDCGNSGTSIRLITGLLAGQRFFSVLTGDKYLRARPMGRIIEPLTRMGGSIFGRAGGDRAPLAVVGRELKGITHVSKVASARKMSNHKR